MEGKSSSEMEGFFTRYLPIAFTMFGHNSERKIFLRENVEHLR